MDTRENGMEERLTGVEGLLPFILRARVLIAGRHRLARSRSRLQFILITRDLSAGSRADILRQFAHYPVVQCFSALDLEHFFGLKNTKVVGFRKSDLAKSLYRRLKGKRVNKPPGSGSGCEGGR